MRSPGTVSLSALVVGEESQDRFRNEEQEACCGEDTRSYHPALASPAMPGLTPAPAAFLELCRGHVCKLCRHEGRVNFRRLK